jgi:phage gpG-like protein
MRVEVTVDDHGLSTKLEGLAGRAAAIRPALVLIADDFLDEERDLFAGRAHWAPLDPAWAARKAKRGLGTRTLVLTGHLERSLVSTDSKYSVRQVDGNELLVGTRDPVAILHQAGTRKMPPRPPVRTTNETQRRWAGILHDWFADGTAR